MEQGLIDIRNKARELSKKFGDLSPYDISCGTLIAILDNFVDEVGSLRAELIKKNLIIGAVTELVNKWKGDRPTAIREMCRLDLEAALSIIKPKTNWADEIFCECGHSLGFHNTAGGFCKHCTCEAYSEVDIDYVEWKKNADRFIKDGD